MNFITFVTTIIIVTVPIISGLIMNMYFYTHRAFGLKHDPPSIIQKKHTEREIQHMSIGIPDKMMGDYVRRSFLTIIIVIIILLIFATIAISVGLSN